MKMRFVSLGLLVVIGVSSGSLRGDDDEGEKLVRAERLVEMTKRWQAYKASLIRDDKETELEPHSQPLLAWQYGVTPIGSAEFHVLLDDVEVYQRGRTPMNTGYPIDPYHSFHVNATRE